MKKQFKCSECGVVIVTDEDYNEEIECSKCHHKQTIPYSATQAEGEPAAEVEGVNDNVQYVVVTDIDMSIISMFGFMIKWAIASIPAAILLFAIFYLITLVLGP